MSCVDWRVLRDDDAPAESVAAARRHLAECQRCRRDALAFDPTLMFSIAAARPETALAELASRADTVERMRERVAGARAMRQRSVPRWRERWSGQASRLAAAVLLPILGAGVIAIGTDRTPESPPRSFEAAATQPPSQSAVDPLLADALARLPLIEGAAPVTMQEEGIGYDLVMVVDAGLEL